MGVNSIRSCCGQEELHPTHIKSPEWKVSYQYSISQPNQHQRFIQSLPKYSASQSLQDFIIQGKLNDFGTISLACKKENEKQINHKENEKQINHTSYAIKRIRKKQIMKYRLMDGIRSTKMLIKNSSNFRRTYDCIFKDMLHYYFVMEYASGGDTYSLIKKGSKRLQYYSTLGQNAVRFIAACLINGLEELHSNNIIYGELKPESVLIYCNGYVKLNDELLAKRASKQDVIKSIDTGDLLYSAPETIAKHSSTKAIDFWALGVYLYQMSVHETPFSVQEVKSAKNTFNKLVQNAEINRNWKKSHLSPQLQDLINGLLRYEPQQRLGMKSWKELKEAHFFDGFDWTALFELKMESPLKSLIELYPIKIHAYNKETILEQLESDFSDWKYQSKEDKLQKPFIIHN